MTVLYSKLKAICEERNITFYAIEKGVGFSRGTLSKWKESMPSGDKILAVANFLDVSVDFLLGNSMNPESHKNPVVFRKASMAIDTILDDLLTTTKCAKESINSVLSSKEYIEDKES